MLNINSIFFLIFFLFNLNVYSIDDLNNYHSKGRNIKDINLQNYMNNFIYKYGDSNFPVEISVIRKDLNNDDMLDAIIFLEGEYWCGSAGCTILLLKKRNESFTLLNELGPAQGILFNNKYINNWQVLSVVYADSMSPEMFKKYFYNIDKYEEFEDLKCSFVNPKIKNIR